MKIRPEKMVNVARLLWDIFLMVLKKAEKYAMLYDVNLGPRHAWIPIALVSM